MKVSYLDYFSDPDLESVKVILDTDREDVAIELEEEEMCDAH